MGDTNSFDDIISSRQMQIIKCALPFIPVSEQKFMSLLVKYQEFQNTINLFSTPDGNLSICGTPDDPYDNLTEMVNSIKDFCSDPEKEFLDMAYNMACAYTLSGNIKQKKSSMDTPNFNIKDLVKNLLTPEQKNLFDNYSSMLGISL